MDFLFEDDEVDPDVGGASGATGAGSVFMSQGSGVADKPEFQCMNCNSTEHYVDESGNMVCLVCFSQSQSQSQAFRQEETMDYDDLMAIAGQSAAGNLRGHRIGPKVKKGRKAKEPLERFDSSKPLPDLKECISGFQAVLIGGVVRLSKILDLNDSQQTVLMETVKKMWMAYLLAWRDGAQMYGSMFPAMRFSLRDAFLNDATKSAVMRILSHKITKDVKAEVDQDEDTSDEEDMVDDGYDQRQLQATSQADSVISGDHKQVQFAATTERINQNRLNRTPKCPEVMYDLRKKLLNKGREEAALSLIPTMQFAAAILWLGVSRIGIIPGQMIHWIANGSLPLLHAYQLLPRDTQEKLLPIRPFFRMNSPPTASKLEKLAAFLAVVCGIKSTAQVPQDSVNDDDDSLEGKGEEKQSLPKSAPKVLKQVRFVSVDCVPLMIGRLVADLRLGQRVLDTSLALIGSPPRRKPGQPPMRLPPPLSRAQPRKIATPEQALAVIVVACKMCPGWEKWSYVRRLTPSQSKNDQSENGNTTGGNSTSSPDLRFVPWNEEQFAFLCNEDVPGYLDFVEEIVHREEDTSSRYPASAESLHFGKDVKKLSENANKHLKNNKLPPARDSNIILLEGISNDKHKLLLDSYSKHFTPYLSYPDTESHTCVRRPYKKLTPEPFHTFYARLIEYIAYKTRVDAFRIHELVAYLDEEVVARCSNQGEFVDTVEVEKEKMAQSRRKKRLKSSSRQSSGAVVPLSPQSALMKQSNADANERTGQGCSSNEDT